MWRHLFLTRLLDLTNSRNFRRTTWGIQKGNRSPVSLVLNAPWGVGKQVPQPGIHNWTKFCHLYSISPSESKIKRAAEGESAELGWEKGLGPLPTTSDSRLVPSGASNLETAQWKPSPSKSAFPVSPIITGGLGGNVKFPNLLSISSVCGLCGRQDPTFVKSLYGCSCLKILTLTAVLHYHIVPNSGQAGKVISKTKTPLGLARSS